MQKSVAVIIGVFFVVGLLVLGISIKSALGSQKYVNSQYSFITVSASASKIVHADGILWPLEIINSGNNLNAVLEKNEKDKNKLKEFFIGTGISADGINFEEVQVANAKEGNDIYGSQPADKAFFATQSVFIQSTDLQAVKNAQDKISELIKQGVVLKYTRYKGDSYFRYIYNTSHEQSLIDEAVANAKITAQKIAEQSNKVLGDVDSISLDSVYDNDYASIYFPSKQAVVRISVTYKLK
jgi:hypothetical protein